MKQGFFLFSMMNCSLYFPDKNICWYDLLCYEKSSSWKQLENNEQTFEQHLGSWAFNMAIIRRPNLTKPKHAQRMFWIEFWDIKKPKSSHFILRVTAKRWKYELTIITPVGVKRSIQVCQNIDTREGSLVRRFELCIHRKDVIAYDWPYNILI